MNVKNPHRFGGGLDLTDSLISYWKMEENIENGTNVPFIDSFGSNDGLASNLLTNVNGQVDNCFNTVSDGDLVRIDTSSGDFDIGDGSDTPLSASGWCSGNDISAYDCSLINRTQTASLVDWAFFKRDNKIHIRFYSGISLTTDYIECVSSDVAPAGSLMDFHHFAFVYTGNESETGLSVFFDGVDVSVTRTEVGTYTGQMNNSSRISIGTRGYDTRGRSGRQDDYKIWSKELTQELIDADYTNGLAGNPMF